ncbi:MAG TPA: MiaB/RimO family radical SAM methylthiotransferase [Gemmatimonadales bacterium]|nr:MiaB/RimO family radical SAM methylthiotransferase [Gemmatimonadales bacterium]
MNVYFHTFGCKANQYDTALVRQAFVDQGVVVVDDPAAADLAVVNSCTVTHESEAKLGRLVRRLARRGGGGGGRLETVVMGCAAARDGGAIAALPSVRAVVGGADPARVLEAAGFGAPRVDPVLRRFPTNARGWLKIQDGCDEHCTFCATTIARGANRSRTIPELVAEATALAEHHTEIVLTGVHIGTYGQDRLTDPGPKSGVDPKAGTSGSGDPRARARGQSTLGTLLEALISAVPQVRFRLSSIEATEVGDTLARLLVEAPVHLAAHLHAPLQSGANRILKRMGRHWYTAESYRARLDWLAERLPVFGLGADIIAGFPGESDAEHRQTIALVDALPFTYLHVFPYSERPGAAAGRLGERVLPGIIRERARELRERGEAKARAHRVRRQGQRADGVVCGRREGKVEVLTEDYLSVYLPTHDWNGRPRFEVTVP